MTMLTLTTGTAFIMWLGEQITERGIGNGMSLIIFAGIVVGLAAAIMEIYEKVNTGRMVRLTVLDSGRDDGRGGRVHRSGRARSAAHHGAVREARRRPAGAGRPVDASSAAGEHRRRDSGDLRVVDSDVSRRRSV